MEINVRYLQADPKTKVLRYRRAFPVALRPFVTEGGRALTELKVSLGARSLDEPGAKARHDDAAAKYERLVSRARKLAAGAYDRLDPPLIRYLADNYIHHQLELDEASRWQQSLPHYQFDTRRDREQDYESSRELLEDYDLTGLVDYWGDWVSSYSQAMGYTFSRSDPQFPALCRAIGEASCKLWLAIDRRDDGKGAATPEPPTRPVADDGPEIGIGCLVKSASSNEETFRSIARGIVDSPTVKTIKEGVREHVRTSLRFIEEVLGDPKPSELTRLSVTTLLDLMAQRPVKLPTEERNLTLPELAVLYEGREDVLRMSGRTQDVRMSALSRIWKEGVSRGDIKGDLENPFLGRRFEATPKSRKRGVGFSASELTSYFSMPVFQSGERPKRGRGETPFWLPLIALYTGARPEEVAQLLVDDIYQRQQDGRWLIRFTDEGLHPVKGHQSLKTERTESGRRTIPVPQPLLELGLLDYASWLRSREQLALFPLLTRKNRRPGIYDSFGGWFADYVYGHGVLERDTGRKPVREFRDTWTTAARSSGIYREAQEYIQGHKAPRGGSSNSDYGSTEVLGSQIDKLRIVDMAGEEVDIVSLVPRWAAPADG
ncbi:hypothetical protein [Qipengyuania gaetbuli]|uniref:hypothetical protein n=1 Tax=Qipengyuania gaetbuli TaxID=266952 RepID=UPI001CFD1D01|nr:hypothetical protein [Qipengyuania gaetbuli]